MNRHEEAIETIWLHLQNLKDEMINPETCLQSIEETLTLLENQVEEDKEKEFQAYLADQELREKGWHHV